VKVQVHRGVLAAPSSRSNSRSARQGASRPASASAPLRRAQRHARPVRPVGPEGLLALDERGRDRLGVPLEPGPLVPLPVSLPGLLLGPPLRRLPVGVPGERARAEEHKPQRRARGQARPMTPGELAQAVASRRRAGQHRLVGQLALHVCRQASGGLVAAGAGGPARPRPGRTGRDSFTLTALTSSDR